MAFVVWWSVAWQLHQLIPSGPWDTSRWVPWACMCSSSSGGFEADFLLEWEGFHSPGPYLEVHKFQRCGDHWSKLKQKNWSVPQPFSMKVVTSSAVLFVRRVLVFNKNFIFCPIHLQKPLLLFFASPAKFNSTSALAFMIPFIHIQATFLHSPEDTCSKFHRLCTSFLSSLYYSCKHASILPFWRWKNKN